MFGSAFEVGCDMTTLGGGWTQLTGAFSEMQDDISYKQYLYSFGGRWYESPVTTAPWSWTVGLELTGTYTHSTGGADAGTSSFTCAGSPEKPVFGIGCSSGIGGTLKVLPFAAADAAAGKCTVCQDLPNALGGPVCQPGVAILVRNVPAPSTDGGVDGGVPHVDGGASDDARDARVDAPGCVPPPSGIVAWWPGDGTAADIRGTHNGTAEGSTSYEAGKVGQAFSFNGAAGSLVRASATGLPAGASARTVELWTKLRPDSDSYALAFGYGAESSGQGYYIFPQVSFHAGRLGFSGHGATYDVLTQSSLDDDKWHHVAVAYNGSTVSIFVDGVGVASGAMELATGTSGGACIGGRCLGSAVAFLTGDVDEVTVYDRALSAAEIKSIFDAGSAGKCK
jgi:hypothetical protein